MMVIFTICVSLICSFIAYSVIRCAIKTRNEIISEQKEFEKFLEQTYLDENQVKRCCCNSCKKEK
jgi:hypothetical protein